jgi:thiamine biosynthesis lipoprotein
MFNTNFKKFTFNLITQAPIIILALLLSSCSNETYVRQSRLYMGTTVSITVVSCDKSSAKHSAQKAVEKAFRRIEEIESIMSYFDKESQLSNVNRLAAEDPIEIKEELFSVIKTALEFSRRTNGAFDITASSLDEKDGYKKIVLDGDKRTVFFKDKNLKIDLGGAAKGYAVDEAISVLRGQGYDNCLVDAGGDIYAAGKYKKYKWPIGIRNPLIASKIKVREKIFLSDKAVATSGNYLRYHVINTLKSNIEESNEESQVISATVIAGSCLEADIMATAAFVNLKDAMSASKNSDNIEMMVIEEKGGKLSQVKTSGFDKYRLN